MQLATPPLLVQTLNSRCRVFEIARSRVFAPPGKVLRTTSTCIHRSLVFSHSMLTSAGTVLARVRGLTSSGRLDRFISARSDDSATLVLADW